MCVMCVHVCGVCACVVSVSVHHLYMCQVSRHCRSKYMDGSVWTRGFWKEGILVTLRQLPDKDEMKRDKKSVMCVEYLLREMENLRYKIRCTVLFYSS